MYVPRSLTLPTFSVAMSKISSAGGPRQAAPPAEMSPYDPVLAIASERASGTRVLHHSHTRLTGHLRWGRAGVNHPESGKCAATGRRRGRAGAGTGALVVRRAL